jgi:hypothetical protein
MRRRRSMCEKEWRRGVWWLGWTFSWAIVGEKTADRGQDEKTVGFMWNRPVRRLFKKPAGFTGFSRFDCRDGLLNKPDRRSSPVLITMINTENNSKLRNLEMATIAG